jgi:NAD(P)-dependent dehydrogenase (short-subunit alcohol dehydrogenase family)
VPISVRFALKRGTSSVTGTNAGIGRESARGLALLGHTVIIVCRNVLTDEKVREEVVAQTGNRAVTVTLWDASAKSAHLDTVRLPE